MERMSCPKDDNHLSDGNAIGGCAMLVAVVGIGSNSLRMLIADIKDAQLHRVLRDREGLRVFAALDENGNISEEMMQKAEQSVLAFVQKARAYQVEEIHVFATSAVRDAKNKHDFAKRIYAATGLTPEVCSGELEAKLSFWGVSEGPRTGMIDIGGGSTEIVVGSGKQIECSKSLQMGAVRLYRKYPVQTVEDARKVVDIAKGILLPVRETILTDGIVDWIGVGGTLTTSAALLMDVCWTSKDLIHGYPASREGIRACMERLAPMSVEERSALRGLHPQRADIVVHGMAILLGCMESLNIAQIQVSECGNLEGYLKHMYRI
jgi:exopolyphosphatase/guanosine-5'-triphosphate,3'-diphosphate pyrophosphatase